MSHLLTFLTLSRLQSLMVGRKKYAIKQTYIHSANFVIFGIFWIRRSSPIQPAKKVEKNRQPVASMLQTVVSW